MPRYVFAILGALILVGATLVPDDAFARGGRGGGGARAGGGGYRAGGMHASAGRIHGGGGRHYAGRPHPSHPIAGRPGRPGYPVAGRPGRPVAGYPGYRPGRGVAYGAAAVGAAAAGAAYYNGYYGNSDNSGCYYDQNYGQYVCPYQNQYQYQNRY